MNIEDFFAESLIPETQRLLNKLINPELVKYHIETVLKKYGEGKFDAAIVAVAHKQFRDNDVDWDKLLEKNHVIFDVKCILPREIVDGRL